MDKQVDIKQVLTNLARHIKERRSALGLSQEKLAERAGLSSNFLARLELGEKTPSIRTLVQLAWALEVHISELLEEGTDDKRADEAYNVKMALQGLNKSDAEYTMEQFRNTIDYLKWRQKR
jgi:transcriptional regulator with XRE-family HTH domain